MIFVFCMNTGNHAPMSEVGILRRQVERHLSEPFEFICITESDLPGWWGKIRLFSPQISRARNLWLDLDVTITGNLDVLTKPLNGSQLRICKNWAQSGHGGCQSSVMYWEGLSARIIDDTFDPADAHWPPRTDRFWDNGQVQHGDQCWMTYLRDTGKLKVEYFKPHEVVSFKYHCQQGLPKDSIVQCFHGKPDAFECEHIDWVKKCRA